MEVHTISCLSIRVAVKTSVPKSQELDLKCKGHANQGSSINVVIGFKLCIFLKFMYVRCSNTSCN